MTEEIGDKAAAERAAMLATMVQDSRTRTAGRW